MGISLIIKENRSQYNSGEGEIPIMSEKYASHNVSVLIYHFVLPTKYHRVLIDEHVDAIIAETCLEISKKYLIYFLKIGTDRDHLHLLVQSVPKMSPTEIVRTIKSITAKEGFRECPEVKKKLWEESFGRMGVMSGRLSTWKRENNIQLCEKPRERMQQDLSRHTGGRTDELARLYVEGETRKPDTPFANLRGCASARQGEMR